MTRARRLVDVEDLGIVVAAARAYALRLREDVDEGPFEGDEADRMLRWADDIDSAAADADDAPWATDVRPVT